MSPKRVLIVHNYEKTSTGNVGTALAEAFIDTQTVMAHEGGLLPASSEGYDGLVLLGGAQNAMDDENFPYFPALLDLVRDFERNDRAVLGICLGAQLLARAFGARNRIGGATEFGWHSVGLTDEGMNDDVLGALPPSFTIFEWHDDTFVLPERATHLATSQAVTNQAFRIGRAAYGFQFHFEASTKVVRQWNVDFSEFLAAERPGWLAGFEDEAVRHGPQADNSGLALARAWVGVL
ncbi:MAG: type 1 glutamine amidotransferase [Rhizobiaceae bacterium]